MKSDLQLLKEMLERAKLHHEIFDIPHNGYNLIVRETVFSFDNSGMLTNTTNERGLNA